ncbi:MAG: hypothetical protein HY939_04250 [Gammaproteobacteria bacterium]|nr:hypothetical protein [Gammaproteobacteria bacterium]
MLHSLTALTYLPVLKSYVNVFVKNPALPAHPYGKNLMEILDYFDVDLSR